jgi:hypothetical protein
LLEGSLGEIILSIIKAAVGLGFFALSINGFLFRKLGPGLRILISLGALALLMPPGVGLPINSWLLNGAGIVLCLVILFWEWSKREAKTGPEASTEETITVK